MASAFFLCAIASTAQKNVEKVVFWLLTAVFISCSQAFQCGSRANFLALCASLSFLIIYFSIIVARRQVKFLILFGVLGLLAVFFMADKIVLKSLFTWNELKQDYGVMEKYLRGKEKTFIPKVMGVCLYHDNSSPIYKKTACQDPEDLPLSPLKDMPDETKKIKAMAEGISATAVFQDVGKRIRDSGRIVRGDFEESLPMSVLATKNGNSLFRLYVWKDMIKEFLEKKPLFGFSFSHPQRSRSIEMLGIAQGEWERDGYITPHNAFLHYIYRGGIVGLGFICGFLGFIFLVIRDFLALRSFAGGFLMAILIYGLVAAQFSVFLELPYHAIPFWAILGITLAYAHQLKNKRGES
ncbi:MAG: O-antigen ligase family protein [Candidatus Omnitrophica bacterium]|nr:O-antigen ligase family protein [Candidatus Omnitrophota bacterium]